MNRSLLALLLFGLFFAVNFGLRTWRHWRATGTTGFRGISGPIGSPGWLGGVLFVIGIVLAIAAPIAQLGRLVPSLLPSASVYLDAVALLSVAIGIAGTWWAQSSMGSSWRIGVREDERTDLVIRGGPFTWIRNPIFTFMVVVALGLALLLPNLLSCAAVVALVIAVELQVRFIEEPYLRRTHGDRYIAYCRSVGRFFPGVGRS